MIKTIPQKDFMVKERGFGIDAELLHILDPETRINILYRGKTAKLRFISTVKEWRTQPKRDYGTGKQYYRTVPDLELL